MTVDAVRDFISDPLVLGIWGVLVAGSLVVLLRDFRRCNPATGQLMKLVWGLTVLYSGPIGLLVYWKTGRRQITRDTLWRRGWRSTAHCYSGCGAGEVIGLILAVGLIGLGTAGTALMTFFFAYVFGFGLTFGPLVQEGIAPGQAALSWPRESVATALNV